jgi:hypothetical protein
MWIKDGASASRSIILDGKRIFNPTAEQYVAAGYEWLEPTVPEQPAEPLYHDAADKELFVMAVTALLPAEVIQQTLGNIEALRVAAGGMMLMTTGAAPDNIVYMDDPRTAAWLSTGGLTVELVKMKMEELRDAFN